MTFCIIYTTTDSKSNADLLVESLLEPGLIACANIYSNVNSIYKWQGNLEKNDEFVIIMKTKNDNYTEIEKLILAKHSYTCPAILQIPILNINTAYKDWLIENLA
jgi:periplasmic divalent cation tolerance protein